MENRKKHICIGLVAHVDAGKTTLSEALLYQTGQIRSLGRVDHQDAFLDNDSQERERGITIFSKQARIADGDWSATILDTPGHVDFSAEMERTLSVLDYAVLVISGTDGVQGHTRTLWKLLAHYQVPVFLFVNKMDLPGADRRTLMAELRTELSDGCVDFGEERILQAQTGTDACFYEDLAVCGEELLNTYMETGAIPDAQIRDAICAREVFPCFFGSALKLTGTEELLAGLKTYTQVPEYPGEFAARVYKIGRDDRGVRLTYLKLTGGTLTVKDPVTYADVRKSGVGARTASETADTGGDDSSVQEKIDQIRLYQGEKYESVDRIEAGEICAVTGLTGTVPGMGLGAESADRTAVLEPVLSYQILLPKEVSPLEMSSKLKALEEEDPQLHIVWKEELQELHIQMMGQVQTEVLTRTIRDRFGVTVVFGPGNIVYRETIARPAEGVGHFEPLRHYAEVHLLLEPGEPGSGIQAASACSTDQLDANWQRLIATHILEKEHRGVLTGSVLTDVKCTILSGRAHPKHTEGGDFRQATYRAIRHGLKCTESVLLEPYYQFLLEIPMEEVGRAMTDLTQRFAKFGAPENINGGNTAELGGSGNAAAGQKNMVRITGRGPVATLQDYISQVHAYTHGLGRLSVEPDGYDVCHNSEEVIAEKAYDSEADLKNPTGSVFCAHGSGFVVPWDEVEHYMHLERAWHPGAGSRTSANGQSGSDGAYPADGQLSADGLFPSRDGFSYDIGGQAFGSDTTRPARASWEKSVSAMSETELDAELADVYAREFGMSRADMEEAARRKQYKKEKQAKRPVGPTVKYDQKGNPIYPKKKPDEEYLIVDGYNIIFAWDELKDLARQNIDSARDRLKDILLNYQAYRSCHLLVVFDAYRVKGNSGRTEVYDGKSRSMVKANDGRKSKVPGNTEGKVQSKRAADNAGGTRRQKEKPGIDTTDGIMVAYTKEDETADAFIERTVHQLGEKYRITVATSDNLEQMTVLSLGALRMSAGNLKEEIERSNREAYEEYRRTTPG